MLYRFNPTTLAFQPKPGAFYFPTPIELLISVGFVSLAIAGFMFAAKTLAILPAPLRLWRRMEQDEATKIAVMSEKLSGAQVAAGD
jgi:Ni/Fe-hydrogenase subunit HybB-like protein